MSAAAPDPQARAAAVRRGAGLFVLEHRGVLAVEGRDARRWLNAMVSNDVASLAPTAPPAAGDAGRAPDAGSPRRGASPGSDTEGPLPGSADSPSWAPHCHACLLTPIGRIVADLHVVAWPAGGFWLDLERHALGDVAARMAKYVIAEDVVLREAGLARLALEGPAAPALARAAAPHLEATGVAGADYALGGKTGVQLFAPPGALDAALAALREAGAGAGLVEGDGEVLEILRVEAGIPRLGAELGEDVLPGEARLEDAVSTTKGCYPGQEVVARMRSRGQPKHFLVGLRLELDAGAPLPAPGTPIESGEGRVGEGRTGQRRVGEPHARARRVGEITSAVRSPAAGAIALGFVARPHHAEGTPVRVAGQPARVAALPFVTPAPDAR